MAPFRRSLAGVRIVHAATSANMLIAFGRVMASRMKEEGAELYFLASSRAIYGRPANTVELSEMGGTPLTIPLDNSLALWNLVSNIYRVWRLFSKLQPDIVHTRASVMGMVARIAARLARVPCIVHHQDDLHAREADLSMLKRWLSTRLECWFANRSHHTFVVSRALAKAAVVSGFKGERITNVGHDLSMTIRQGAVDPPDPSRIRRLLGQNGVTPDHFVIGAITRLEKHKGVDTLIKAAARVVGEAPEVRFVIRGRGPEKDNLKALIIHLGLLDQFVLIDAWLSDHDLVALYQRFNLFALPTRREGFGMAFAEAMLLGAVPVAPDIEPVNEVVAPDNGILVEPKVVPFANALLWAYRHPIEIKNLRRNGERAAENRWGSTKAADAVISTYLRLLSNGK